MVPLLPDGPASALDLGSGGGLPGLPLALATPGWDWTLLDGSVTRTRFLAEAVSLLHLHQRVKIVTDRAEHAGHSAMRSAFDVVVARSFAPPATTAECAAPFLKVGGLLIVAEPPGGAGERWPAQELELLGLAPRATVAGPSAFQLLEQVQPCPDRYPRRTGIPAKRPLF